MAITVKMSDGTTWTDTVAANAPVKVNRWTGAGLVNAAAATQSVRR
jgi:hypothetical protein